MFSASSSVEKIVEKALKFLEKGKHDKAVQVFEAPLKKEPKDIDLLLGLAEVYCRIQETPAALREYRKAFKAQPQAGERILAELDSPPGGAKRDDFFELRVEILIYLRDLDGAYKVVEKTEGSVLARVLDRTESRIAELRKISIAGQNALLIAELSYFVGLILEFQQAYGRAFPVYTSILKVREEELLRVLPRLQRVAESIRDDAGPLIYMGDLLRGSDPEKAAAYYQRALHQDAQSARTVIERFGDSAKDPWELWLLGKAYLIKGEWAQGVAILKKLGDPGIRPEVIGLLRKVDSSQPDTSPVLLFLGDLLVAEGDYSDASRTFAGLSGKVAADELRERFLRLIEVDPENIYAAQALGEICLDEGDLANSMDQMRKIVQADPAQTDVLFDKTFPLMEKHPDDPHLCLFLAELCMGHPEAEHPVVLLRRFVQIAPERADRVPPLLQKLVQKHPSHPDIRIAEAEAMMALGRNKEAFQSLQVALLLDPGQIHEAMRHLWLLVERDSKLSREVMQLLADLEGKGISGPAADLLRAKASLASGAYEECVDRLMHCVVQAPERVDVVETLIAEWEEGSSDRPEFRMGLAKIYVRLDRWDEANTILQRFLQERPEAAGQVVSLYEELRKKDPKNLRLYQGLLAAYLAGGAYDLILDEGKKLEKVFAPPEIGAIHRIMGDACKEMGRFSDAVSWYFQSFKDDPDTAEAVGEKLGQILSINPSLPKASLALGTVLAAAGKVKEGVEHLMRLVRDLPKSRETVLKYLQHISAKHPLEFEPILGMAELHILEEAYEVALEFLWKAIHRDSQRSDAILRLLDCISDKNPEMARVHLEMGKVYLKVKFYAKASEHLVRAVKMDLSLSEQGIKFCHDIIAGQPAEISAYEAIAEMLEGMQRPSAAISFLSASAELHPEVREALVLRMEKIAERVPENDEIQKILAWNYLHIEAMDRAVHCMKRSIELEGSRARDGQGLFSEVIARHPDHADALFERGRCRMETLDLEGAFTDIQSAVQLDSEKMDCGIELLQALKNRGLTTTQFYLFLAELYGYRSEYERAVEVLEQGLKSVAKDGDRASLLIQLAENHERLGEEESAQRHLEEARRLSGDNSLYYEKLNEFSVRKIRYETSVLEQEASGGPSLPLGKLKRLVSHLVLMNRSDDAERYVRTQSRAREAKERKEIWAHYQEESGNYALAVQLQDPGDLGHRAYLLERAGDGMLAASLLEKAVREDPDPALNKYLMRSYSMLMEESLLREKRPLMGETRLRISGE